MPLPAACNMKAGSVLRRCAAKLRGRMPKQKRWKTNTKRAPPPCAGASKLSAPAQPHAAPPGSAPRRARHPSRPAAPPPDAPGPRPAPRAWPTAAGDGERLPLLAGLMLAGEMDVPEALRQQWLLHNPLRQDTLARLVQHMPAPADYIDTLDEMLPQAAADEMLAELGQGADAAFTANEQPTLMQACVWLLLWVYAGAKNAEGQGGGVQGDAVQIAAFTAEVLAAPLQTASVRLPQQRWQNIQAALNDAAALPEPERRRILPDCIQIAEASPDLLRAQIWLYTLRVAWDLPSEAV